MSPMNRDRVGEIFRADGLINEWVVSDVDSAGVPTEYATGAHSLRVMKEGGGWIFCTHDGKFLCHSRVDGRRGRRIRKNDLAEALGHAETLPPDPNYIGRYGSDLPSHLARVRHEAPEPEAAAPAP